MTGIVKEGDIVRGYRLDRLIAEGGMGAVWAATHTSLGRRAAVKILAPSLAANREYVSRFLSEAQIVNDFRHPNIVDIFDFVEMESPHRVACIMELLEGPTLAQVIKQGKLSAVKALQITLQLVDALDQVHAAGVVHRDLKPQNIIIVAPLDADFTDICAAKILDFGIAKQGDVQTEHKTATGAIMGTPAYMAPEQVAAAEVSAATDLYALAEMLAEMLTGQRLYRGDNLAILRQKMMSEAPDLQLPSSLRDAERVAALLRPCLAPEPHLRPSLGDFGSALQMLLEEWSEAHVDATSPTQPDVEPPPTQPGVELPSLGDLSEEPAASTQMFYERILEDIDEAVPGYVEPGQVSVPALSEAAPSLVLGAPLTGQGYGVEGPAQGPVQTDLRLAEATPTRSRPPILVVPGQKISSTTPWGRIAGGLAGLAVVAGLLFGAGSWFRTREPTVQAGVQEATAKWHSDFAPFTGSSQDFLKMGSKAHTEDSPAGYVRARDAFRKALILRPQSAEALGRYLENEVVGFGGGLLPSQRGEYQRWLGPRDRLEGAARRAAAQLTYDAVHKRHLTQVLLQSPSGQDRVAGAALIVDLKPQRALAALDRKDLPVRAVRIRARGLARLGRVRAALKALVPRQEREPNNRFLRMLEAELWSQAGQLQRAEHVLAKVASQLPLHPPSRLRHGILAARLGKTAVAAGSLKAVAEDTAVEAGLRAEAYAHWARLGLAQQAYSVAEARADQAHELRPGHGLAALVAAEAKLQQGKPQAAQAAVDTGLTVDAEHPALGIMNATLSMSLRQPKAAMVKIEAVANRQPADPRIAALAASFCAAAGDDARTQAHIQRLLELDPRFLDHEDNVVWVTSATYQVALEALRLKEGPSARVVAGVLHYFREDSAAAKASLRQADQDPVARLYRAQLWLDRKAPTRASTALGTAKAQAPSVHLLRGRIAALRGATMKATAEFGEAAGGSAIRDIAKIESAVLTKDMDSLTKAVLARPDDRWLAAALYQLERD